MTDTNPENIAKSLNQHELIVAATKQILLERIKIEKEMEIKSFELNLQYSDKFNQLNDQVVELVFGRKKIEPKTASSIFTNISKKKVVGKMPTLEVGQKGLPNYWLYAMKNVPELAEMISLYDEPLLKCLTNIVTTETSSSKPHPAYPQFNTYGLLIEFTFSKNEYFTNQSLYKFYTLGVTENKEEPFEYDGLQPTKIDISPIEWLEGKNLTVRQVKKTQKHKSTKQVRHIVKSEKKDSFFNYFSKIDEIDMAEYSAQDKAELVIALMESDFELAHFIHTDFIPKSILFYLDEVVSDEFSEDEDEDDENDDENDDDESESSASLDNVVEIAAHSQNRMGSRGVGNRGGRHAGQRR